MTDTTEKYAILRELGLVLDRTDHDVLAKVNWLAIQLHDKIPGDLMGVLQAIEYQIAGAYLLANGREVPWPPTDRYAQLHQKFMELSRLPTKEGE